MGGKDVEMECLVQQPAVGAGDAQLLSHSCKLTPHLHVRSCAREDLWMCEEVDA